MKFHPQQIKLATRSVNHNKMKPWQQQQQFQAQQTQRQQQMNFQRQQQFHQNILQRHQQQVIHNTQQNINNAHRQQLDHAAHVRQLNEEQQRNHLRRTQEDERLRRERAHHSATMARNNNMHYSSPHTFYRSGDSVNIVFGSANNLRVPLIVNVEPYRLPEYDSMGYSDVSFDQYDLTFQAWLYIFLAILFLWFPPVSIVFIIIAFRFDTLCVRFDFDNKLVQVGQKRCLTNGFTVRLTLPFDEVTHFEFSQEKGEICAKTGSGAHHMIVPNSYPYWILEAKIHQLNNLLPRSTPPPTDPEGSQTNQQQDTNPTL
jgi:type II secretory pathway pseudopilin PulG